MPSPTMELYSDLNPNGFCTAAGTQLFNRALKDKLSCSLFILLKVVSERKTLFKIDSAVD